MLCPWSLKASTWVRAKHQTREHVFLPWPGHLCAGKRQRLESLPESQTVNKLLECIGRGGSHIQTATDIARAVRSDGLESKALAALTSCGAHGVSDQNTERDLHRWLRGLWGFELEPYRIELELSATRSWLRSFLKHSGLYGLSKTRMMSRKLFSTYDTDLCIWRSTTPKSQRWWKRGSSFHMRCSMQQVRGVSRFTRFAKQPMHSSLHLFGSC